MLFRVDFITYNGTYRSIETDKLSLPAIDGRRTLLSNHMPTMIPIDIGVIETSVDNKLSHWAVSDGMVLFEDNVATVLCDEIISVEEINIEEAQAAINKARKKLAGASRESDIMRARVALARATNLIDLKNKYLD